MQIVKMDNSHLASARVDAQVACPNCSARAMLRQNGTIICYTEDKALIPEVGDKFFGMRESFEAQHKQL